ncbi:unnamed protein product, partial [Closterium sp. Naga37s-1]
AFLNDLEKAWGVKIKGKGADCKAFIKNIRCDGRGMISMLDFSRLGLSGSIPESISSLTSLSELTLSDNLLTGFIPNGIGNIHSLKD